VKTADFVTELTPGGQICVPPEIAAQVPHGERLRVILAWGQPEDEAAWKAAGRRQFEAAYTADDSIYESLIDEASPR